MTTRTRDFLPLVSLILLWFIGACATTGAPVSSVPAEPVDSLVDPRAGYVPPAPRSVENRFAAAWENFRTGNLPEAERGFRGVLQKDPSYEPADLALAAIELRRGELDAAERRVERVIGQHADSFAARAYAAEIAARRGNFGQALEIYQQLQPPPETASFVTERIEQFRKQRFEELYADAVGEEDPSTAADLLREALSVRPDADAARILLVRKLVELGRFDDARRQLEPLLRAPSRTNDPDVQDAMARIDVGKGRYQDAIRRYEQLARAYPDRFSASLAEVKQKWVEMNLPPEFHEALASAAVTRAELAVLVYWKIPVVRFAQNLPEPPIAIDVASVSGREEFVRALALGLFPVDPVTRRANPERVVTAGSLLRIVNLLLALEEAPPCADGGGPDGSASLHALALCGFPSGGDSADFLDGKRVAVLLDAVAARGRSAK